MLCFCLISPVLACLSLKDSQVCSKFSSSFIDQSLTAYPFLADVGNASTFDMSLLKYIQTDWPKLKYSTQFSCPTASTVTLVAR